MKRPPSPLIVRVFEGLILAVMIVPVWLHYAWVRLTIR